MEIENSGNFVIFGVFGVCLELQRGQVVIRRKKKRSTINIFRNWWNKKIQQNSRSKTEKILYNVYRRELKKPWEILQRDILKVLNKLYR